MSEDKKAEGEATPKKKGGKLPMIVIMAVVLGAGGFFGMKMRAPKDVKKPEIKLGKVVPLEEFLVNLSDGSTYLRTTISLHMKDGLEMEAGGKEGGEGKGGGGGEMDIIRDAVIGVLTSQSPEGVRSLAGKKKLRAQIAEAVNKQLEEIEAQKKDGKKEGDSSGGGDKKEEGGKDGKEAAKDGSKEESKAHPDWDSQEGPVLKVYFTSFATQ